MMTTIQPMMAGSDRELVSRSLEGDRDAFSLIVSRYQNLICSLAYSAMGNLGQSEDAAQETFITAWKHLRQLREPERLRQWLCGIARNLVRKHLRREGREAASLGESLDSVAETVSSEASPAEHTISKEEEAILWRALEQIPETYREALVLYYREHQSMTAVAESLNLTEDAVKQRLSRGRKLLHREVVSFVEGALGRTAPGQAFSGAVVASLPATSASWAAAATAKGATAAKSGWLTVLGPLLGIFGGMFAHWLVVRFSPNLKERQAKKRFFISLWIFILFWCAMLNPLLCSLAKHNRWPDAIFFPVMAIFWWLYAVIAVTMTVLAMRRFFVLRRENDQPPLAMSASLRAMVTIGTNASFFVWILHLARKSGDQLAWHVSGSVLVLLTIWNFLDLRNKAGESALRAVSRQLAGAWVAALLILNWRLDRWIAAQTGIDLPEVHRLLPLGAIYLLTLALVVWAAVLSVAAWKTIPTRA
jgi:RNA polymerase sigma factor (sigma-70 family)